MSQEAFLREQLLPLLLNSSGKPWQESLESGYIYHSAFQWKCNCVIEVLINLEFQHVLYKIQEENGAACGLFPLLPANTGISTNVQKQHFSFGTFLVGHVLILNSQWLSVCVYVCVQVHPGRCVYVLCFYILAIFFLVIFLSSCFLVYSKYLCCICSKYRKKHHFNCVMISSDLICHCKHCCGSSVLCTNSWKIANGSKNVSFYGRRRHTSGNGCCKWKMIFLFFFYSYCIALSFQKWNFFSEYLSLPGLWALCF